MSAIDHDSTEGRDLLVSGYKAVRVEEIDGKPVARLPIEQFMQGHTFCVDLTETGSGVVSKGPFRIEYVLGTEFVIHEHELPAVVFEQGYSHLKKGSDIDKFQIALTYFDTRSPDIQKSATLSIGCSDDIVQKLIIETPESDLESTIVHMSQIVADLLDAIALTKRVPISIRHIEVRAIGSKWLRRYVTLPYGSRVLTAGDFTEAATIPWRMRSALRLFREALNSSKPHYRLLCLYRTREPVDKIRSQNDANMAARNLKPDRVRRLCSDNLIMKQYFPTFIGKKVGAFLDHVRNEYRLNIAHANMDEYFKLALDPANVRTDHRIDYTNAALIPIMSEMIRDEIGLMRQFGITQ
jgi:hypothetical protein